VIRGRANRADHHPEHIIFIFRNHEVLWDQISGIEDPFMRFEGSISFEVE